MSLVVITRQRFLIARRREVTSVQTFVMICVNVFHHLNGPDLSFQYHHAGVQNCESDFRPLSFSLLWEIMVPLKVTLQRTSVTVTLMGIDKSF